MKVGDQLLIAALAQAKGELEVHKANIQVYQTMPAGIGEHSDITEAIQVELDKIARYHDQVEVIDKNKVKMENVYLPEKSKETHYIEGDSDEIVAGIIKVLKDDIKAI